MRDNEERNKDNKDDWWKKKCNDAAAVFLHEDEATEDKARARSTIMIVVPTKTEDGGSSNQQQEQAHINQGQGQGQETRSSARPDAFTIFSDDDTRMLTLLGLEPTANPNEGEQEDWRQLTGFTGLGRRSNEDEDGNRTAPRRTRLSFELHPDVFLSMWYERGELEL
mmetsp:Transcript_2683/g.4375  ORF Transcript_2683/g.4375 Transcript_2683/m.4375 type:complete len:167 (-) Transcript_2683:179-679(-)